MHKRTKLKDLTSTRGGICVCLVSPACPHGVLQYMLIKDTLPLLQSFILCVIYSKIIKSATVTRYVEQNCSAQRVSLCKDGAMRGIRCSWMEQRWTFPLTFFLMQGLALANDLGSVKNTVTSAVTESKHEDDFTLLTEELGHIQYGSSASTLLAAVTDTSTGGRHRWFTSIVSTNRESGTRSSANYSATLENITRAHTSTWVRRRISILPWDAAVTVASDAGTSSTDGYVTCQAAQNSPHITGLERAKTYVWLIPGGLLIVSGIVGNCFTLIVLHSKHFRLWTDAMVFALSALAVVDIVMLLIAAEHWLDQLLDVQNYVRTLSVSTCQLVTYLAMTVTHVSSWTVVIVTVHRAVLVLRPYQAKRFCGRRHVVRVWVFFTMMWTVWNAHCFWSFTLIPRRLSACPTEMLPMCQLDKRLHGGIVQHLVKYGNFVTISALPCMLICIANGCIVHSLASRKARLSSPREPSVRPTKQHLRAVVVTRSMLCVSTLFVLCTLPSAVFFLKETEWFGTDHSLTQRDIEKFQFAASLLHLFRYLNNGVNFFFYVHSGRAFRKACLGVFCKFAS